MIGNHHIRVERRRSSHQYKAVMNAPDSWDGDQNCHNNRRDTMILYDGEEEVWRCDSYQTVANIPGGRYLNTVAPGGITIEWDVEPRQHRGHVHGITLALDLEGQFIDGRSIEPIAGGDGQPIDLARWLVHDTQKLNTGPAGECRAAWSAGCFITGPAQSDELHAVGASRGFVRGDLIPGVLVEVDG